MILDTCALLWLATGDKKLSAFARQQIEGAAAVHVSAISGFGNAVKSANVTTDERFEEYGVIVMC